MKLAFVQNVEELLLSHALKYFIIYSYDSKKTENLLRRCRKLTPRWFGWFSQNRFSLKKYDKVSSSLLKAYIN